MHDQGRLLGRLILIALIQCAVVPSSQYSNKQWAKNLCAEMLAKIVF